MQKRFSLLVVAVLLLTGTTTARAQILFDLSPVTVTAHPGDLIKFFASVTNNGPDPVILDSLTATFLPDLDRDEDFTPFFNHFAGVLNPGVSLPTIGLEEIYALTILPTAGLGTYNGLLSLFDPTGVILAEQEVTITVIEPQPGDVPEAGALVLLGAGFLGALSLLRRRR